VAASLISHNLIFTCQITERRCKDSAWRCGKYASENRIQTTPLLGADLNFRWGRKYDILREICRRRQVVLTLPRYFRQYFSKNAKLTLYQTDTSSTFTIHLKRINDLGRSLRKCRYESILHGGPQKAWRDDGQKAGTKEYNRWSFGRRRDSIYLYSTRA